MLAQLCPNLADPRQFADVVTGRQPAPVTVLL
jgi:hypothetical protein